MKKILAFTGSNNPESINEQLIQSLIKTYHQFEINLVDLKQEDIPIYSQAFQSGFVPEAIQKLYTQIGESEGVILASPEHNGLPSAFLKNVIDWLSVIEHQFFQGKPILLLSSSPGSTGASSQLNLLSTLLPYWGGKLMATYSLGSFNQNFDEEKTLISNAGEQEKLAKAFHAFTQQHPIVKTNNADVVKGYFKAFQTGNTEAILNSFHPDCYVVSVKEEERAVDQLHGIYRTRQEVNQFIKNITDIFETQAFVVDSIVESEGNLVISKGSFSHLVKSTGKLFNSNWVQLCIIEDGMIKEYRFYEDSAALIKASQVEIL